MNAVTVRRAVGGAILLGLVLGALPFGCGSAASDFCDEYCACEACSDRELDECIIRENYQLDAADVYGCVDLRVDWEDCALRQYHCRGGVFSLENGDCNPQLEEIDQCKRDGSAL